MALGLLFPMEGNFQRTGHTCIIKLFALQSKVATSRSLVGTCLWPMLTSQLCTEIIWGKGYMARTTTMLRLMTSMIQFPRITAGLFLGNI